MPDSYDYSEEVISNRTNDYTRDRDSTASWPWTSHDPTQPSSPYGSLAPSDSNPFVSLGLLADATPAVPTHCGSPSGPASSVSSASPASPVFRAKRCYLLTVPIRPLLRTGHLTAALAAGFAALGMDHLVIEVGVAAGRIATIGEVLITGYGQPDTHSAWLTSLTGYRAGHLTGIAATGPLPSPTPTSESDEPRY